jgi:hypothetical protein
MAKLSELLDTVWDVVDNADAAGCTEDLVVTSARALADLKETAAEVKKDLERQERGEKVKIYILWGQDRSRLMDEWSLGTLFDEDEDGDVDTRIREFFEERPDATPDVAVYEFDTQAEANCFLQGVDEGNGWLDYAQVEASDSEQVRVIRKLTEVYIEMHKEEIGMEHVEKWMDELPPLPDDVPVSC